MMVAARFGAFVFDLDGTLVRLPVDWDAVRARLKALFETDSAFVPLFESLKEHLALEPGKRTLAFGVVDEAEAKAAAACEPVGGALELVKKLGAKSSVGLVTMQGRRAVDRIAEDHGLVHAFAARATREDSLDRAEQLGLVLQKMSATAAGTLFVGDRANDAVAGRKAGVRVAIIGKKVTGEAAPDYAFGTILELAQFLGA
ncbi:MAG: HAD family hydrolase [archaeon]|nr:MAG: HAD family hydrolase [archaeon]